MHEVSGSFSNKNLKMESVDTGGQEQLQSVISRSTYLLSRAYYRIPESKTRIFSILPPADPHGFVLVVTKQDLNQARST